MPLYRVKCSVCDITDQIWRKIADRDNLPACACGAGMLRVLSAPFVRPDLFTAFESPATGKIIDSRAKLNEDLRVSGCILKEPGMEKDIARNRVETHEKAFKPIAAGVDIIVRDLVSAGKLESL